MEQSTPARLCFADSQHAHAAQVEMMRLGAMSRDEVTWLNFFAQGESQQVAVCVTCSPEQPSTCGQAGAPGQQHGGGNVVQLLRTRGRRW